MAFILNIETATTACSVALSEKGVLIDSIDYDNGYSHAENLHSFIDKLLKECNVGIHQLNAIAVSKGPGSYTGLRIGVSAAKGLAYALNIPLISVDTLKIITVSALEKTQEADFFCPMIDARRMEVYMCTYNRELIAQSEIQAFIINDNSIEDFKTFGNICFFGNGFLKAKEILSKVKNVKFLEGINPSAKSMTSLSYKKFLSREFESVMYFEPFYLKEFLILKKI